MITVVQDNIMFSGRYDTETALFIISLPQHMIVSTSNTVKHINSTHEFFAVLNILAKKKIVQSAALYWRRIRGEKFVLYSS